MQQGPPLGGVRIVECSQLLPAEITTVLADLGADVVKVEPPQGDYMRHTTWPMVEGVSLAHLHINRGKRSIVLDLRTDAGRDALKALAGEADAVVEAMRPGGLDRRGVGYEALAAVNPRLVYCSISGYGSTGPYRDLPSHGIGFDTWAGIVNPARTEDGYWYLPEHASVGIHTGPLFGAIGILAAIVRARATGRGSRLEIAQSEAAAATDWLRIETWRAYERPEDEVTGTEADGYERRAPGTGGMIDGVRYQVYEAADGQLVLFMASEREFWRNFCEGVGRRDLFDRWPGSRYGDHARGNTELRSELRSVFTTRTAAEWVAFGSAVNTPIVPVNSPRTVAGDPQFLARTHWLPEAVLGADELPSPIRFVDEDDGMPAPAKAPTVGEHTTQVLHEVLGWDDERIADARRHGAFGDPGGH